MLFAAKIVHNIKITLSEELTEIEAEKVTTILSKKILSTDIPTVEDKSKKR